jgi:hypothetical protein
MASQLLCKVVKNRKLLINNNNETFFGENTYLL